jgi:hypothetical protein
MKLWVVIYLNQVFLNRSWLEKRLRIKN